MTEHRQRLAVLIRESRGELAQRPGYAGLLAELEMLATAVEAGQLDVPTLRAVEDAYFHHPELAPSRGIRRVGTELESTRTLLVEIRNHRVQLEQPPAPPPAAPPHRDDSAR